MTDVIVAFTASISVGIALGGIGATLARGSIRPCRRLREHQRLAVCIGASVALMGATAIAIASAHVDYQRALLVVTCAAIALLVGVVAWLLLVETNDGDAHSNDNEPEWWPVFERELQEWTRRSRVPSHNAR